MFEKKRIACLLSDKKLKKLNWFESDKVYNSNGYEFFKLDLEADLKSQGGFHILLHKLVDTIALGNQGDKKSLNIISLIEDYLSKHPDVIVIDPIRNVCQLVDRCKTYSIIDATDLYKYGVFTPTFCEIKSTYNKNVEMQLKSNNVGYPFVCKPLVGKGSKEAHDMFIIFNKNNLHLCKPPCVVQTFINHNATLYKMNIVGEQYHYSDRPSLKNFYAGTQKAILFHTRDVSKANSESSLSILDIEDEGIPRLSPNPMIMCKIASTLRKAFGMDLLGIDVIIENFTGKYAIIDVNPYPSYDGFPNFFHALLDCIKEKETKLELKRATATINETNKTECHGHNKSEVNTNMEQQELQADNQRRTENSSAAEEKKTKSGRTVRFPKNIAEWYTT
ncbi:hypothetical protein RN001_002613 [Aquatica leii]|uniref:Inositol-tetrakisphosphate 1-kinase n=1 Tax=Aquatica leii TaxID=1421715 RepID=A0AAN7Q8S9_9COLE|nr:hypothetical protein RN001_002613 [Aquatica leii]